MNWCLSFVCWWWWWYDFELRCAQGYVAIPFHRIFFQNYTVGYIEWRWWHIERNETMAADAKNARTTLNHRQIVSISNSNKLRVAYRNEHKDDTLHREWNSISTSFKWLNYWCYSIGSSSHRITSLHSANSLLFASTHSLLLYLTSSNYTGSNGTFIAYLLRTSDPITYTGCQFSSVVQFSFPLLNRKY